METSNVIAHARNRLHAAITERDHTPGFSPMEVSVWVAMSLLQKAIRRGEPHLALQAAATLLRDAPDRLWRRIAGIAFEDLGLGDLETVALAIAALGGTRLRERLGGEWAVASIVVSRMAKATKCRASDDLLMSSELHPTWAQSRREFAAKTTRDLLEIAGRSAMLQESALALWYALGTNRWSSRHLKERRGEPGAVFDHLGQIGVASDLIALAREGFNRTRSVLPVLVAQLSLASGRENCPTVDDVFPPAALIGNVPGWAYDLYSREGRRCFAAFLEGQTKTARWIRRHVPSARRINSLGRIVFRLEGGRCKNRLAWKVADQLRELVDHECHGEHCLEAADVIALLRDDFDRLNEVRKNVL
jgi:hypothetical protein